MHVHTMLYSGPPSMHPKMLTHAPEHCHAPLIRTCLSIKFNPKGSDHHLTDTLFCTLNRSYGLDPPQPPQLLLLTITATRQTSPPTVPTSPSLSTAPAPVRPLPPLTLFFACCAPYCLLCLSRACMQCISVSSDSGSGVP